MLDPQVPKWQPKNTVHSTWFRSSTQSTLVFLGGPHLILIRCVFAFRFLLDVLPWSGITDVARQQHTNIKGLIVHTVMQAKTRHSGQHSFQIPGNLPSKQCQCPVSSNIFKSMLYNYDLVFRHFLSFPACAVKHSWPHLQAKFLLFKVFTICLITRHTTWWCKLTVGAIHFETIFTQEHKKIPTIEDIDPIVNKFSQPPATNSEDVQPVNPSPPGKMVAPNYFNIYQCPSFVVSVSAAFGASPNG